MHQQPTPAPHDMPLPDGIDPHAPIEVTPAERLLLALGVGSLATFMALGEMNLGLVSIAILAVCVVLMVFRKDRSTRRSAMKLYPHLPWAEYAQSQPRAMWLSVAIFAALYLIALAINVYVNSLADMRVVIAGALGALAVVSVYFLPLFRAAGAPQA